MSDKVKFFRYTFRPDVGAKKTRSNLLMIDGVKIYKKCVSERKPEWVFLI